MKVLVKVAKNYPYAYYRRAGLALTPGDNIVDVDAKQLAALKADHGLLVGPVPTEEPKKPEDKK